MCEFNRVKIVQPCEDQKGWIAFNGEVLSWINFPIRPLLAAACIENFIPKDIITMKDAFNYILWNCSDEYCNMIKNLSETSDFSIIGTIQNNRTL